MPLRSKSLDRASARVRATSTAASALASPSFSTRSRTTVRAKSPAPTRRSASPSHTPPRRSAKTRIAARAVESAGDGSGAAATATAAATAAAATAASTKTRRRSPSRSRSPARGRMQPTAASPPTPTVSASPDVALPPQNAHEYKDRLHHLTLLRSPIHTVMFFFKETLTLLQHILSWLVEWRSAVTLLLAVALSILVVYLSPESIGLKSHHSDRVEDIIEEIWYCSYWVWLGVLSSVGLGTGLHTFLLYTGPFIAEVTMAAWKCGTLDFVSREVGMLSCPVTASGATAVTIWGIVSKVRLEAFLWGAGTAIGELPPYFIARAARLSGSVQDELEAEMRQMEDETDQTLWTRLKRFTHSLVSRLGFWGILACASIPNPLFDLAGVTCGHFLVPFGTFFGATLIGKAVVKMHIQMFFVVLMFSEPVLDAVIRWAATVLPSPLIGQVSGAVVRYRAKFDKNSDVPIEAPQGGSLVGFVWEMLIIAMLSYFAISIVNSLAQRHVERQIRALEREAEAEANAKK